MAGQLADPRVQDLGDIVGAAPAAGVIERAQVHESKALIDNDMRRAQAERF